MSETIIDFGGFTVDVSKIQAIHGGFVIDPKDYTAVSFFSDGQGRSVAFGYKSAPEIIAAYEKHKAKVARENLADGWYWVTSGGGTRKLIRVIRGEIEATWGEPAYKPKVTESQWSKYELADPLSAEFMHAMRNQGFHPADWL